MLEECSFEYVNQGSQTHGPRYSQRIARYMRIFIQKLGFLCCFGKNVVSIAITIDEKIEFYLTRYVALKSPL